MSFASRIRSPPSATISDGSARKTPGVTLFMPLFSHKPSSAVKMALVDRWVPTDWLTYPPCQTLLDSNPTFAYGPEPVSDRPDRTGISPSIRWDDPVPVSVAGGFVLPVAVARTPWMVNRRPPTEFAVCFPVYVVEDCTEVPACRYIVVCASPEV